MSRIAVVTDLDLQADEGMAVTTRSLLRAAPALGLEARVLGPSPRRGELARRTSIVWAAWELRRGDPNGIILYIPRGGLTRATVAKGELLARVARKRILQLILQSDEVGVAHVSQRVEYLGLADSVTQPIVARGGAATKVQLGVDRTRFIKDGRVDTSLWPKADRSRILHVGHLNRGRNVGVLAELSRRGFACLLIASPSTRADGDLERELTAAGVAVIREHVEDLPAVYRGADVYVFPVSDRRACTTTPLSVLEALACGTQVVSTPFGALDEIAAEFPALSISPSEKLVDTVGRVAESPTIGGAAAIPTWEEALAEIVAVAPTRQPSKLVLLLGLDGTGKSTQSELLIAEARRRGLRAVSVWARWDPLLLAPLLKLRRIGGGDSGDPRNEYLSWKRRFFRSRIARAAWRRTAAADHFLRVGLRLRRALRENDVVVCDRYYHDALIDMAVGFNTPPPDPVGMHRLFPRPDLTLLLDAEEEALVARKEDMPSLTHLALRRPLYLEMAERNGWPVVDATRPAAEVHETLVGLIWNGQ